MSLLVVTDEDVWQLAKSLAGFNPHERPLMSEAERYAAWLDKPEEVQRVEQALRAALAGIACRGGAKVIRCRGRVKDWGC